MSIGFELETQSLAPVLVVDNPEEQSRIKTVNAGNFKHLYNLSQQRDLDVYGDVFTQGYAFDRQRKRFLQSLGDGAPARQRKLDENKDFDLVYQRKGEVATRVAFKTSTKDVPLLFSNAEFIVTFRTPVEVPGTRQGILSYLVEKLAASVDFVLEHLATLTDRLILANKMTTFPYPYLSRPVDTTVGFRQGDDAQSARYDMAYLSQIPLDKVLGTARFVPQCTLGVPFVCAVNVLGILVDWLREFVQEDEYVAALIAEFDDVLATTKRLTKKIGGQSRGKVVGNAVFLFLYAARTKEKRKTASLFTLRHTCQDLLEAVLTPAERNLVAKSLPEPEARFFRELTEHPLSKLSAQECG